MEKHMGTALSLIYEVCKTFLCSSNHSSPEIGRGCVHYSACATPPPHTHASATYFVKSLGGPKFSFSPPHCLRFHILCTNTPIILLFPQEIWLFCCNTITPFLQGFPLKNLLVSHSFLQRYHCSFEGSIDALAKLPSEQGTKKGLIANHSLASRAFLSWNGKEDCHGRPTFLLTNQNL